MSRFAEDESWGILRYRYERTIGIQFGTVDVTHEGISGLIKVDDTGIWA